LQFAAGFTAISRFHFPDFYLRASWKRRDTTQGRTSLCDTISHG
jgi:hypothetical protein